MSETLTRAQAEWFSRPADQRFTNLSDLKQSLAMRRDCSDTYDVEISSLTAEEREGELLVRLRDVSATPTHWFLSQLCSELRAPASYLRTLSIDLLVRCLNEGLQKAASSIRQVLRTCRFSSLGYPRLRALTSPKYGRIWDAEVVEMVEGVLDRSGGRFKNPPDASGLPSGLYASDRDVFLFFIDGGSLVDGGSERDQLHRGFYLWNSEVKSARYGASTFFHRAVCGNHMILGAENISELSFRHTKGAPKRFLDEARDMLEAHVDSPISGIEDVIQQAKRFRIPADTRDLTIAWTEEKGFSHETASSAYDLAVSEEGQCQSLWDLTNGLTALARDLPNMDARVSLERAAGRLLTPAILES